MLTLLSFLALAQTSDPQVPPKVPQTLEIKEVNGQIIHFKEMESGTPAPLETTLHEIKPLGILSNPGSKPFVLLQAQPCEGCEDHESIYLIRADGGKPSTFTFPGQIRDPKSRKLIHDSRSFYGQCLRKRGQVYVAFQKDKADRRRWLQTSVLVAEMEGNGIKEHLLTYRRKKPHIKHTLRLVKKGLCKEIKGKKRLHVRRLMDLNPKKSD